jgi:hypothetical protein
LRFAVARTAKGSDCRRGLPLQNLRATLSLPKQSLMASPRRSAADRVPAVRQLDDSRIRSALLSKLIDEHKCHPGAGFIEELGLCRGSVRVDVVVVNSLLCGYEIKSDRDSLRRLANQAEVYGKVLDQATLVVGKRLCDEALVIIPKWWGVLRAVESSDGLEFKTVRRAKNNPQRNARAMVELLWFEHALALLEQRGATRGVRGKPRRVVWDRICERFDLEEIADAVRGRLKARAMFEARA